MIRIFCRLIAQGIRDLFMAPLAQLATLSAVILVAFLAGLFLMALTTLDHQLSMVRGETAFQVYWQSGADMNQVRDQWENYQHLPGFKQARTFTPEEALAELGLRLGRSHGNLENGFPFLAGQSPLPATALLTFAPQDRDLERWINDITVFLSAQPGVERVVTTPLHDELGRAWRKVSRYVMWPSVAFLTLVLGLVVGTTVRLSLSNRASEIEILQLAGAHNWYIRTPLVVSGAALGFLGSLIAVLLLFLVYWQIRDALNFPPLLMEIRFLSLRFLLLLVC
ncbi:permease, partial [Desulfovibrio sp. OttesenSCG-928-A18]|nr:permease [Desulfovibrio sp. OttesenSCG-928-A18]